MIKVKEFVLFWIGCSFVTLSYSNSNVLAATQTIAQASQTCKPDELCAGGSGSLAQTEGQCLKGLDQGGTSSSGTEVYHSPYYNSNNEAQAGGWNDCTTKAGSDWKFTGQWWQDYARGASVVQCSKTAQTTTRPTTPSPGSASKSVPVRCGHWSDGGAESCAYACGHDSSGATITGSTWTGKYYKGKGDQGPWSPGSPWSSGMCQCSITKSP